MVLVLTVILLIVMLVLGMLGLVILQLVLLLTVVIFEKLGEMFGNKSRMTYRKNPFLVNILSSKKKRNWSDTRTADTKDFSTIQLQRSGSSTPDERRIR